MTMALATPIYVAAGFAVTARINSIFLSRIFRRYTQEEEEAEDESRATA